MRLSQKIRKLFSGEAVHSARRHVRAFVRNRRFPARISTSQVIKTIDHDRFAEIKRKYFDPNMPADAPPKYLELQTWMRINIQRVRELGLDYSEPLRILDLGCGAGYFLYTCKLLGHEVLGLDMGNYPMFTELTELLQVPRIIARIDAFRPLPQFERKFHLITAFLVCFNNHKSRGLWGPAEWDYFLDDVARHLKPNGRVWLELNREPDGSYYSEELANLLRKRGAQLDSYRVIFNPGTLVPGANGAVAL